MAYFVFCIMLMVGVAGLVVVDSHDRKQTAIMMHTKEMHRIAVKVRSRTHCTSLGERGNLDSIAKVIVKWEMR